MEVLKRFSRYWGGRSGLENVVNGLECELILPDVNFLMLFYLLLH